MSGPVVATPAAAPTRPARLTHVLQRKCACGGTPGPSGECAGCRNKRLGVQRSAAAPGPGVAPAIVHDVLAGSGRPLDAGTRAFMEPRFGHSFADVRVHDDARAAASARAVGAHAYTAGPNIAFGSGRYDPGTLTGTHLLAHELAHVVQQDRAGRQNPPGRVLDSPVLEREAQNAANDIAAGRPARVGPGAAGVVQRFESQEHQSLGNQATGGQTVNVGGSDPATRFELSHGDVVALSGDYFEVDELMRLGATPGRRGQAVGTRDEIIYVLHHINSRDPRFRTGGIWHGYTFADAVVSAADSRYQQLAARNTSHFVAPRGYAASGAPNPPVGGEGSAGTSYRTLHERAIRMAYQEGQAQGGSIDRPMAMEAAAQHFLTDAFAAGHLRTPAGSIRDHWRRTYPLFWYNLLHKMALDTAVQMNAQTNNLTTAFGTVHMMYSAIMTSVNTMAASLPAITLGDLLAKVFHDYDNAWGVAIQGGGVVYGDASLDDPDPRNRTRPLAQAAILAGTRDVREAFALGQAGGAVLASPALYAAVQSATGAPSGTYMPETHIPRPDASVPRQNWNAPDFETLWGQHIVGTSGPTVGDEITAGMAPGKEMRVQLEELALKFPEVETRASGNLRPRDGYRLGFLAPLVANPRQGILDIIHWAPNYGLRSVSRDDVSLETGEELDSSGRLGGMTTPARAKYVRELIDGSVADSEEALVVRIFETAPVAERRRIYEAVEGHAWTGDWIQGWTVSDDDIWNALNATRLANLKTLINAGSAPAAPAGSGGTP